MIHQFLPTGFATWKDYTTSLLKQQDPVVAAHYEAMFAKFVRWHESKGKEIFDAADPALERRRQVASWRRMANVILANDVHGLRLSFSPTVKSREIEQYLTGKSGD